MVHTIYEVACEFKDDPASSQHLLQVGRIATKPANSGNEQSPGLKVSALNQFSRIRKRALRQRREAAETQSLAPELDFLALIQS